MWWWPFSSKFDSFSAAYRRNDPAAIADWFAAYFFLIGLSGLLLAAAAAWAQANFSLGLRVLGVGLLFAGACGVCGWVLGLLFGIPRWLARPTPETLSDDPASRGSSTTSDSQTVKAPLPGRPAPRSSSNNTNLEDISDWLLTKTLVGVGLTQLYRVPSALWAFSAQLNVSGFQWFAGGQQTCAANCTGPGTVARPCIVPVFRAGGLLARLH